MTSNESSSKISKKNKKQQLNDEQEVVELTKDEKKIASYLRLSCPNKQAALNGMKVDFFIANKLVDCLMESKWGPGTLNPQTSKKNDAFLPSRQACVNFMQRLMNKQLFYRAFKVYKETSDSKAKETNPESTPNLRKRKEKKEKENQSAPTTPVSSISSPESNESKQQQQKKKFKLDMHEEQKFLDANEPYVWVYDPTSTKTYIIGLLLILGAIGICLFPLWPSQVREGVYYLSLAGASFLGAILGLAAFKYVLFAFIWLFTLGKIQFWLFPNLTEDVGFFESFVPVYKCNLDSKTETKKEDKKELIKESSSQQQPEITSETKNTESSENVNISEPTTSNSDALPTLKEISKSTIEICKSDTPRGSPAVNKKNKIKKKDSLVNDEDGFELVDDDEIGRAHV